MTGGGLSKSNFLDLAIRPRKYVLGCGRNEQRGSVGQPLLAVLDGLTGAKEDSQEWLSY